MEDGGSVALHPVPASGPVPPTAPDQRATADQAPIDDRVEEFLLAAVERRYREVLDSLPTLSLLVIDPGMTVRLAAGSLLRRAGYDPDSMIGRPFAEVAEDAAIRRLVPDLQRALRGESIDTHYVSPVNGWEYVIRIRPLRNARGAVVGGLLLSEDVTGPRLLQRQLERVQRASRVGSVRYEVGEGWVFDAMLWELLGLPEPDADPGTASTGEGAEPRAAVPGPGRGHPDASWVIDLVVPEDRARVEHAYRRVLADGGETTVDYRMRVAASAQLQYVRGTCQALVDDRGRLLRAMITHSDVTGSVRAMQSVERARAESSSARTQMLRQASDLLVDSGQPLPELVQKVTELAAAGLGDGAMVRIVDSTGRTVEADYVADRDPAARARLAEFATLSAPFFDRTAGVERWIYGRGRCVSSLHPDAATIVGPYGLTTPYGVIPHYVLAPIRHDGTVLGVLGVVRRDPDRPYEAGDDDLTQVLADRLGTVVAQGRTRAWVEQQGRERALILGRITRLSAEQRELVDQLGDVEQRERILLAEAIHDDPMQTIVAAAMRIDTLAMTVPGEVGVELERLVDMLESAVGRLRTLIVALNPPDLSEGLGPALLGLARGIFTGTSTQVRLEGQAHVGLSTATKGAVYRIFREALVNARKHARASEVTLRIEDAGDVVRVSLVDDGIGSDSFDSAPGHLGMVTMRARANAEGGYLSVTGTRGEGTHVVLVLPKRTAGDPPGSGTEQGSGVVAPASLGHDGSGS